MKASSLLVILVSLSFGMSADAFAKKGGSSHASSHTTSHSNDSHATSESGVGVTIARNIGSKSRRSEEESAHRDADTGSNTPESSGLPSAAEKRQAIAEAERARSIEQAAIDAQRKQQAEQAATAAAKAREAAASEQQREAEALARQQREAAWISRCNIQPVMTDEAIATCRTVMTQPAPLSFHYQETN